MALKRTVREIAREEVQWELRDREEPLHYIRFGNVQIVADCYDDDGKGLVASIRQELERMLTEARG